MKKVSVKNQEYAAKNHGEWVKIKRIEPYGFKTSLPKKTEGLLDNDGNLFSHHVGPDIQELDVCLYRETGEKLTLKHGKIDANTPLFVQNFDLLKVLSKLASILTELKKPAAVGIPPISPQTIVKVEKLALELSNAVNH